MPALEIAIGRGMRNAGTASRIASICAAGSRSDEDGKEKLVNANLSVADIAVSSDHQLGVFAVSRCNAANPPLDDLRERTY
jgi:hypothetical protein